MTPRTGCRVGLRSPLSIIILVYNNTFKENIKILSFFTNYDFKIKLIYIIRNIKVVVEKVVIKVY